MLDMSRKMVSFVVMALIFCIQLYACTDKQPAGAKVIVDKDESAATPAFGNAPLTVSFDAGKYLEQSGGKFSLLWNFDDGSISTETSPKHKFNVMGTYMVSLTVIRPDGIRDAYWTTVIVN